jgi:ATP-dependent exoDNAse (exonuclease V) beta subunit
MTNRTKNFEVVRASAGSGKTYRLVLRYLECALRNDNPRMFGSILALTFTNKAAAEMKGRILEDLDKLARGGGDKKSYLVKHLKISEVTLLKRAKRLHKEMLHRYSDIAVMTIDSFVNRLVRSFARDLALDQDFRIELDSDKIIDEAVSQLLDKVGREGNESLSNLLEGFADQQVEEDKDARVRNPLKELGKAVVKENMRSVIDAFTDISPEQFKDISIALRKATSAYEKHLKEVVQVAKSAIIELGMIDDDFAYGEVPRNLKKLEKGRVKELKKRIRSHLTEPESMLKKNASVELISKAQSIGPFLIHVHDAAIRMLPETEEGKTYLLSKNLLKRLDLMGTLSELYKEIERVQTDNNVRTFGAMHKMISKIVRENPAPFIYERLGSRYSHIFMDEFQDTSITQWHNLVVLYDHSLGINKRNLVVGDGKQAIYRWRNGDYKQLMDLPSLQGDNLGVALSDAERSLTQNYFSDRSNDLKDNWRTGSEIVEWNNTLFSELRNHLPLELKKVYDGLNQTPKKKFPGGVHLELVCGETVAERRKTHCEVIIERIRAYEAQGFDLGDITILVRTNREGAHLAQEVLKAGIKPMTEESLQLGRHPGPIAVSALIRWILRPDDYRNGVAVLQCVAALNGIDEVYYLDKYVTVTEKPSKTPGKRSYSKGELDTAGMLKELFPGLKAVERSSDPVATFVGHVCETMGITKRYPAYAEGVIELAHEVGRTDESGLHGFIRFWDRKGHEKSVVTIATKDAVQIMTVHKAKGLAFKVVIALITAKNFTKFRGVIPVILDEKSGMPIKAAMLENFDMKDTAVESQRVAEVNKVILDQTNAVYVAFTRPVERLDIVLELEDEDFDRNEVKTVGELIVKSLEIKNGTVSSGNLTQEPGMSLTPEGSIDSSSTILLENLFTGESVNHLVTINKVDEHCTVPDGLTPSELGTEVHKVLEKLNSKDDWESVKKSLSVGVIFGEKDRLIIEKRVENILNLDGAKGFFTPGLHVESECDFVDIDGGVSRPDRIVRIDGVWHIIDYKTTEAEKNKHTKQVERYVDTLKEIEGGTVKGWLLYTEPIHLVSVK